jgi:glucokinase
MKKILAFDIGGSKIAYTLISEKGHIFGAINRMPTPPTSAEIEAIVQSAAQQNTADGLAIATAGVVFNNHLCGKPNNLPAGYENIEFNELTGLPYLIENDANAAAWAEYKCGALQGYEHCALLTLGTDVGCGLILNGDLYRGKSGAAGEVSFAASGTTLAHLAEQNSLNKRDCFEIHNLAQNGDATAKRVYDMWLENLVIALVQLNQILDLEAVALSGSLAQIVDYEKINAKIQQMCRYNPIRVMAETAENNDGLIGAALLFAAK